MAAKRKLKKTSMLEETPAMTPVMTSVQSEKPLLERAAPILLLLVVVMAFGMGMMWTKLQGGSTGTTAGKYKTFDEAMKAVAKKAGFKSGMFGGGEIDNLLKCMNSGDKKTNVDADTAEGVGVGVNGKPAFFINGRMLSGAQPFEEFKKVIDEELNTKQNTASIVRQNVTVGKSLVRGTQGAPVTIIEYSDFQCPFCSRAVPTVDQVLKDYAGKVQLAYKHFPLTQIHPRAQKAAELTECARDAGKFWEMHDALFEMQQDWAQL